MINDSILASRLLYLPLDLQEKILLWLTYRGLKPVSEITALKRNEKFLRLRRLNPELAKIYPHKEYNYNSRESKRIRKWIVDAGLSLVTSSPEDFQWFVSKDANKSDRVLKLLRQFDKKSQIEVGLLLGFPKDSVKAYADNLESPYEEVIKKMIGFGKEMNENVFLKGKYYTPYIFYNIPKDKVEKDSQIAKIWADTIRKDIPKLAKWFEKKYH